MNTQTHMLMGAVLFGRKLPRRAWAGVVGGLLPDLPMIMIVMALKIAGVSERRIFGEIYFQYWCEAANGLSHSFILWGLLLVLGAGLARRRGGTKTPSDTPTASLRSDFPMILTAVSGSAFVHSVIDFLCHREDAHMHFWPFSNWIFVSPVSYYDPRHFGQYFGLFESALGLACAVYLFRHYRNIWVRAALVFSILTYVAVPIVFMIMVHGRDFN